MRTPKILSAVTGTTGRRRSMCLFLGAAFGISWLLWIPAAVKSQKIGTPPLVLFYLGGFGPSIAGTVMTYLGSTRRARKDFWRRMVSFTSISTCSYLFIFGAIPILYLGALLLDCLVHGTAPAFPYYSEILGRFPAAIAVVLALIVAGPLSEELGWRGFALDRLRARWNQIVSALVLGAIWWAWHLPVFFMRGTTHGRWGLGSPFFFLFLPFTISLSVVMSWLYYRSGRSILSAILVHFTSNASTGILPGTTTGFLLATTLLSMTAVALAVWGGMNHEVPPRSRAD